MQCDRDGAAPGGKRAARGVVNDARCRADTACSPPPTTVPGYTAGASPASAPGLNSYGGTMRSNRFTGAKRVARTFAALACAVLLSASPAAAMPAYDGGAPTTTGQPAVT